MNVPSHPAADASRFVFAGPLQHGDQVGGVVVLFQDIAKTVSARHRIFDTNARNHSSRPAMVLAFLHTCMVAALQRREIALHGTAMDFQYLGLILLIFNQLFGLQYHTRKFAGDFDQRVQQLAPFWRKTVQLFLKNSKANFFETRNLVATFGRYNKNTFWLPNYRPATPFRTAEYFGYKIVFVGHVAKEKGVADILTLSDALPAGWCIDVYGPLVDFGASDFNDRIKYRGILARESLYSTLSQYCALLLPSYREGYPGIIIESFSIGLPVIVSDLPTLREIVDDSCGEFIQPGRPETIVPAIDRLATGYSTKRQGALAKFDNFDRSIVLNDYFQKSGVDAVVSLEKPA